MFFNQMQRALVPGLVLLALAGSARADLKVVSKMTMDAPAMGGLGGGLGANVPLPKPGEALQTITYYKGSKTRVEEATGAITITDNTAGTVTRIDPKKKTYSVVKIADMTKQLTEGAGPAAGFLEMLEMKVKSDVKKGGHERVIAGKKATDYLWTATMSMSMKGGEEGAEVANISMEGEQWTSEEIQLPDTAGKSNAPQLPGIGGGMMGGMMKMMNNMPGMKSLTATMAQIKGFSLLTNMKIKIQSPFAEAQGADLSKPVTNKTEVVELSEAELPESLFVVPTGLKKVPYEMPQIPGFGG
ncbi:hypothetical protein [Armatimonas sp.]|uniref:hypothetical protein n=1 Tax=Armatimonas sp. TaxID=1872638 RepID=UPI003750F35A